ncbi:DUF1524 domain-containing protein [Kitasatospora sp. NPDC127060]|uniref:GmrSD restriction endonuclease domain-containing protein n=1 Tax=Kitasatospora sp. NPDC127060 TaxID=3347121 RepID=UPI00364C8BB3
MPSTTRPAGSTVLRASTAILAVTLLGACTKATTSDRPAADAAPPSSAAVGWPGPQPTDAATARVQLTALTVAPPRPMTGYSRDHFPHWASQGAACDTRESVLKRDGQSVVTDAQCRSTSGTWISVYDGLQFTDASKVDIDHLVPLAAGWRAGADSWTDEQRKAFANDLTRPQLLAVSAASNRAKGDQTPDQWKPPSQTAWCRYAEAWTNVKTYYKLTVTEPEKTALGQMLDTCPAGS